MRGFLVGSFALIVVYVAVQPGSAAAATAGGNVLVSALRRLLSGDVAGVPQRKGAVKGKSTGSTIAGAGGSLGGGARVQYTNA